MRLWLMLLLAVPGCASFTAPRPNEPSETVYTSTIGTDEKGVQTRTVVVKHKGTENETRSAPVKVGPDGSVDIGGGKSVQFDWSVLDAFDSTWYLVIGSVLLVGGIAVRFAPVPFLSGVGIPIAIVGGVMVLIPLVADQIRILVIIGGTLTLAAVGWWAWTKRDKIHKLISDGIDDRTAKGDAGGAGALAFVASGGDKTAARAAKQEAILHTSPKGS